jgi:hypothetical protein
MSIAVGAARRFHERRFSPAYSRARYLCPRKGVSGSGSPAAKLHQEVRDGLAWLMGSAPCVFALTKKWEVIRDLF